MVHDVEIMVAWWTFLFSSKYYFWGNGNPLESMKS